MKNFIRTAPALFLAAFASAQTEGDATLTDDVTPFAAPAPPAPSEVMMLQLRDGSIHWGAIEAHDPTSIAFVRLDNGGRVQVPWGLLSPNQSETLRKKYGYVEVEVEAVFIEGQRLTLKSGGTIEGVIVNRDGPNFEIKTDGNIQAIPKSRVAGIESPVQIPALDVFSREELYVQYLSDTDVESASAHLALARRCEGILDFVHAVEHYDAALTLHEAATDDDAKLSDSELDDLEGVVARARIKAANQQQVEYLREADRLRKRGQFDNAALMLAAFEETFEDSPLIEDKRKQETRLLLARDAAAKKLVTRRWKYWAGRLSRQMSQSESFEAARTWALEQASEQILRLVAEDVNEKITKAATIDMVRQLWDERDPGRYRAAAYGGDGTWLLGEDAAQAGMDAENTSRDDKGPVSEVDAQRKALEERIKRYLQNQKLASRNRQAAAADDERQKFWANWTQSSRASWLFAYYVENSGDFELRAKPYLRACRTCGGTGAIELLVTGTVLRGETQDLATCPLCHGVQVTRRIYYR